MKNNKKSRNLLLFVSRRSSVVYAMPAQIPKIWALEWRDSSCFMGMMNRIMLLTQSIMLPQPKELMRHTRKE